ncbi:MAG: hypothetical protein ACOYNB_03585 [Aquabacterium sp.]|uniref:hypothetical protein n=1 Tax=Aquabacterium sp. TaxID=1872578 RepID=UPI003BE1468A
MNATIRALLLALASMLSACTLDVPQASEAIVALNAGTLNERTKNLTDDQMRGLKAWFDDRRSGWLPSYVTYAPAMEVRVKGFNGNNTIINIMPSKVVVYGSFGQYEQRFPPNELSILLLAIGSKH